MPQASGYLLDTNILLRLLRGKDLGHDLEQQFGLHSNIANCIISHLDRPRHKTYNMSSDSPDATGKPFLISFRRIV